MSQTTTRDSCIVFNTEDFQEKIHNLSIPFKARFNKLNRNYVLFYTFFIFAMAIELISFGLFFSEIVKSTLMAFWLAGIFLTVFSYLVLLFYLQGRRPEKLMQLKDEYIKSVQETIPFDPGTLEYHCCITEAIFHFISQLRIPSLETRWLLASETFTYLIEKFWIWTKWKDLLKIKEMLLLASIQEHIRLIKKEPTDLEAHASLASNYLGLSHLYEDPKNLALNENLVWIPQEYESEEMRAKCDMALSRALEEYHIIDEYAPSDPWVHAQRAAIYKELGRVDHEQKEYETILEMDPNNEEILLRLGRLYFRQGENAKGLKVFNKLKTTDEEKAHFLINHYDAYSVEEYSFD